MGNTSDEASTRRSPRALLTRAASALLLLLLLQAACSDDLRNALEGEVSTSGTILSALSQAQTEMGDMGTLTPGDAPSGTTPDFTLTTVPGSMAITNGGTATVTLSAASAFSEVSVGVAGVSGHYLITLPAAMTSVVLQLTVDQGYRGANIVFEFTAGDGVDYGPVAQQSFDVIIVGSGDIQVSLTFDQQDDLDLSVMDPNGDTVFWGQTTVPSGGTLDLDANPVCGPPTGNSENITWPAGTAIDGSYSVFIDMFDSCFPTPVNWTLTISVLGTPPTILTGTLGPSDEGLGPQLVAAFTVGP